MRPIVSGVSAAMLLLVLAGCGDPAAGLAEAGPATGSQLQKFSREATRDVKVGRDGALLQRYCSNLTRERCPADTVTRLGEYGFKDGGTGVDLAYAFIGMAADAKDGTADKVSSDEDFIAAAYRVALGREPDAEGAAHHLGAIKGQDIGARKTLVLNFLKSPEFNAQQ